MNNQIMIIWTISW